MRVNGMFSFPAHSPVLIEAVDSSPFINVLSGMVVVDHQVPVLERLCPQAVVLEEGRAIQVGTWDKLRQAPAKSLLEQLLEPFVNARRNIRHRRIVVA
jgi:ABC-type glutathione transport system ATPase component